MKKIVVFALMTALCMTVLTSCDMSGGLVSELFGAVYKDHVLVEPTEDYVVIEPDAPWGTVEPIDPIPPVESMDTILPVDPIPAPWVLPTLKTCGFIGITLHTPDGKSAPLMTFGDLEGWNGVLDLGEEFREWGSMLDAEDFAKGELRFRGYAAYDVMPDVYYYYTVMSWYGDEAEHSEPISIVTPDAYDVAVIGMQYEQRMTVFEFTVPLEALWNTGETLYLSGEVPIDALVGGSAPVIYEQKIVILMPQPEIGTEIVEETVFDTAVEETVFDTAVEETQEVEQPIVD